MKLNQSIAAIFKLNLASKYAVFIAYCKASAVNFLIFNIVTLTEKCNFIFRSLLKDKTKLLNETNNTQKIKRIAGYRNLWK